MIEKNTEFERENRYLVLKHEDIKKHLSGEEAYQLCILSGKVSAGRFREKSDWPSYVVVKDTWPEYEIVWKMIEDRMTYDREE